MKEQGRHMKQRSTANAIACIALIALSITLTIVALSQKPKCVYIHNTETVSLVEREAQ